MIVIKLVLKESRFDNLELDDSPTPSTPSKRGSIPDPKQYSSKYDPVKNAEPPTRALRPVIPINACTLPIIVTGKHNTVSWLGNRI